MAYEVTATYTISIFRQAALRYYIGLLGRVGLLAVLMIIAMPIFLAFTAVGRGLADTTAILAGFTVIIIVGGYFGAVRSSASVLREMDDPSVSFVFDDEGVSMESSLGSSVLKWQVLKKLWKSENVWLLFTAPNQYLTLPTASLTEEAKAFIVERIRDSGGEIRG